MTAAACGGARRGEAQPPPSLSLPPSLPACSARLGSAQLGSVPLLTHPPALPAPPQHGYQGLHRLLLRLHGGKGLAGKLAGAGSAGAPGGAVLVAPGGAPAPRSGCRAAARIPCCRAHEVEGRVVPPGWVLGGCSAAWRGMKRGREPGWAPWGGSGLGQQAVCGRVAVPVSLCVCPRVRLCPRVSPLTAKPTQKVRLCPRGQPRLSGSALKIAGFLKERCFEPKIQGLSHSASVWKTCRMPTNAVRDRRLLLSRRLRGARPCQRAGAWGPSFQRPVTARRRKKKTCFTLNSPSPVSTAAGLQPSAAEAARGELCGWGLAGASPPWALLGERSRSSSLGHPCAASLPLSFFVVSVLLLTSTR